MAFNEVFIRPKILLKQTDVAAIVKEELDWHERSKLIREVSKEGYRKFLEEMWENLKVEPKLFYAQLRRTIKYKGSMPLVSKITVDSCKLNALESKREMLVYYKKLFNDNQKPNLKIKSENPDSFEIEIRGAMKNIALDKTVGINKIPGDWIRISHDNLELEEKLKSVF